MRKASGRSCTKEKLEDFVATLAATCNVTLSAEAAGISVRHAYKLRNKDAAFRAGWLEAMGTAYSRLELVLLDRAFNGTEKVVPRKDGGTDRMLEYSNQLGLQLLKMHRDTALASAPENEPADIDEIRERLFRKLERLRKREEARSAAE
ncbi:hypothetical protein G7078_09130 [Sphingomonas sinipercae]|uniref:Uncharacterized protein n=1 Tax=Sphingomonas sinipercae TaxID=2714944 RepID=A0A6G7ZPU5_9SPHN|nr:hypothetical protein [Sphingomonas sinipercae]QIL02926.1 hypothetical protein G7078_09130 [Sphingomonas sinipercae]